MPPGYAPIMSTDFAHSEHAERRRTLKAASLLRALSDLGIDARSAVTLDDQQWRDIEARARTRPASRETRRVVIDLLAHAASERTRPCPTCGEGNPLGMTGPPLPVGHLGVECRR